MSDKSNAGAFNKLVPGFDFLQGLVKNAGSALPSIGQWVAPTLNPEELEKRIEELRTVQFWLEQNARMLDATIQALEVQRMTLATLKTMNVPLAQLRDSLRVREPDLEPQAFAPAPVAPTKSAPRGGRKALPAETATPAVDPMQWWGALTKQFTTLAATAMKDSAGGAAKSLAGSMVRQSFDAAEETLKKAVSAPGKVAGAVVKAAGSAAKPARTSRTPRKRASAKR
jgi:prefoldin subunit 5